MAAKMTRWHDDYSASFLLSALICAVRMVLQSVFRCHECQVIQLSLL